MKTVQMTLDEDLMAQVDATVEKLGTTRSAFTRDALRAAMVQLEQRELERKHRKGYQKKPVKKGEFSGWESQQAWGEP
jgi:metal-responsive CopG/Arc/MetJ family transcriptional regulator